MRIRLDLGDFSILNTLNNGTLANKYWCLWRQVKEDALEVSQLFTTWMVFPSFAMRI